MSLLPRKVAPFATLACCSASLLAACGTEDRERPLPPIEVVLERIALAPDGAMITKGDRATFAATGAYSDGTTKDLSAEVTWRSSAPAIATVIRGEVTALDEGQAEITARLGEIEGRATVVVTPSPLTALTVEPGEVTLEVGGRHELTATGEFADGASRDVTSLVTWISSDTAVATVEAGRVVAVAPGTATISARDATTGVASGDASATVTVLEPAPTALEVLPSGQALPIGLSRQFTATAIYENGDRVDVTELSDWSSSNDTVAEVENGLGAKGMVTALTAGITSITAVHPSGLRASTTVRVTPPAILTLTVTPTTAVIGVGQNLTFRAVARYTDNTDRDLTNVVTWASSDEAVLRIGHNQGQRSTALGLAAGTAVISALDPTTGASSETTGSSASITVTPPSLQSIAVLPLSASLPFGATQQMQAVGLYSDNTSQDLTGVVVWTSSNPAVATVDAAGFVATVAQGSTTVAARHPGTGISSDDSERSAAITVLPPALVTITVTPSLRAMVVGSTQQFTATGLFSDGVTRDITTSVNWLSSSPAVTVSAAGLASAVGVGVATISAQDPATSISSNASNGSAAVTVSAASLLSIAVIPTSTTVPPGADIRFRAVGTYDNGATSDITDVVVWSVGASNVARVENASGARGVASALAAGSSSVQAVEPSTGVASEASSQSGTLNVDASVLLTSVAVEPRVATITLNNTLRPLRARGTFSNGARYDMTQSVTWSSSSPAVATVSNTAGTRGVVNAVAVGGTTVSALHQPSGIGSVGSNQSAAITVEVGIVTASATYPGPMVSVDGTADYGINVGSAAFTAGTFNPNMTITNVTVTIDFLKTDGTCAAPAPGFAYHNETNFRIQGPSGTQVILAQPNTWSGGDATPPVTVVFDQSAASIPSGTPSSGTFRPSPGNLGDFNGQSPLGSWVLQAGDTAGADPLCVYSWSVTVTAQ